MTIKEQIVDALREVGYDFFAACEHAQAKLDEIRSNKPGDYKFVAGNHVFTVRKH